MRFFQCILIVCCLIAGIFWIQPATVQARDSFTEWLEEFQAYDVLESQLSRDTPSPDTLLHRANLLLQSNDPRKALEILDRFGVFPERSLEAQRIWTKARALRSLNRPLEALLTYSRAAGLMSPQARKAAVQAEPDLKFFWKITLKKWIFDHCYNGRIQVNDGQKTLLMKAADQAERFWSSDSFWNRVQSGLSQQKAPPVFPDRIAILPIDFETQHTIVQSLAALAVQDVQALKKTLKRVSRVEVRQVWTELFNGILGRSIDPLHSEALNIRRQYPKYQAAVDYFLPVIKDLQIDAWQIAHPGLSSWDSYRQRLHTVSYAQALKIIENELNSVLLSQAVKQVLNQYYFAYALMNERRDLAKSIWPRLDLKVTPLSLKFCGLLFNFDSLENCFPGQEQFKTQKLLLASLLGMTGVQPVSNVQLPFWVRLDKEKTLFRVQEDFPLDVLLAYAVNTLKWQKKETLQLAKECGLLFPRTSLGSQALLYLARNAYENGQPQIAWDYLQHMNPEILSGDEQLKYFQAKGGLLMDLGRVAESLKSYQELLRRYPDGLKPEKKLKLALLAQRQGEWSWAQKVLEALWEQHADFSPELQAEIMFWLGEGAQKAGDDLKALKYYLRLAWEFPEQNIWAVTALYRSALIYEKKGELSTARNLFKTVLKKAERDSQKQAAQDRIDAIEDRLRLKNKEEQKDSFLF